MASRIWLFTYALAVLPFTSHAHLVDPQLLVYAFLQTFLRLQAAFPAFIIHLLGIKTDLQDLEAWK
jgi:hypothetical protein